MRARARCIVVPSAEAARSSNVHQTATSGSNDLSSRSELSHYFEDRGAVSPPATFAPIRKRLRLDRLSYLALAASTGSRTLRALR